MKARGYWEKDGTRHAWFGADVPEGAIIHEGEAIPAPLPSVDQRDKKIADIESELAAIRDDVEAIKAKEKP